MFAFATQAHRRFALLHTLKLSSPSHLRVGRIPVLLSGNQIRRVPRRLTHTISAMTEASTLKYIDVGLRSLGYHFNVY
jgi:hypothetical protein